MLSKEGRAKKGIFQQDKKIIEDANQLNGFLTQKSSHEYPRVQPCYIFLRVYSPILHILGEKRLLATEIIDAYCQPYDVNYSNEADLTLLHHLIIIERFDLAQSIIQDPDFTKINYTVNLHFI